MATAAYLKPDEISESLDQWIRFCSILPNRARGGEVIGDAGAVVACSRTVWPMGNIAVFTNPVNSVADLDRRVGTVHEQFKARQCNGVIFVADNLVGLLLSQMSEVFARYGYLPYMNVMGMATEFLVAPLRPLPDLQYRLVCDAESRRTLFELNAIAYEVAPEWSRDYDERTDLFSHGAVGVIGHMNDHPAACAVTVPLDGRLYMALVATAHEFRRLGCAEAVMRRSLQDAARVTGFGRTVLHATPMGRPLYSQMGYHDTLPFMVYAQSH